MDRLGYDYDIYITQTLEPYGDIKVSDMKNPTNVSQDENTGVPILLNFKRILEGNVDYNAANLSTVHAIRPDLAGEFCEMPDEDLLAAAIIIVCRKPQR